ncbi:MAG: glycoside hydrolase family 3 C-terminal domain-containing protein [Pyrinomonadaceae bacterium]|nr:glycoside hydrolase family 3 C-terminal domain-containing protein [Pyrinomonadaceae bacterium]
MLKIIQRILPLLIVLNLLPTIAFGQFRPDGKAYKWADKHLKTMSIDEKIGQMIHIGINADFMNRDSAKFREFQRHVRENHIGGIIVFVGGVYDTAHFINRMQEISKIPLLISADLETGAGMRFPDTINFPWNMAIAATGDASFAFREGAITAREARAMGIHWNFAPVVDVNNNARNPVINVRSYGEDPNEVGKFATEFMRGLQSGNVLATAKHFPGHGDTAVDSHRGLPEIDFSRERLEKTEFVPFREIISRGVGSVMISHIAMPQLDSEKVKPLDNFEKPSYGGSEVITEASTIPATLSRNIVTGILKNDMKFDGLIVTDAMDMSGLTIYFDAEEAAVRAVLAGNDVLLKPSSSDAPIRGLKKAVESGRITEKRIDESVRKILAWKYKLGLKEKPFTPLSSIDSIVSSVETGKLSDEIADRAITLVKNENDVLPLKSGQKALLLAISNGEDRNFIGNAFASRLRRNGVEVERVAIDARANEKEVADALKKIGSADLIIAGLFGRVRSGAKNSVGLPESGEEVLRAALRSDARVISAAFGNPYLLLGFPEMKNYIVSYGDMNSLQRATADALTGRIEFSGRLPITIGNFPRGTGLKLGLPRKNDQ